MNRNRKLVKATLVAIAALVATSALAGCAPTKTVRPTNFENQAISWNNCPNDWYASSDYQSKQFLAGRHDCTTIYAPSQYEKPRTGPAYKLALMRTHATGKRYGTLFINPGGPGGSGIEELQWSTFPEAVLEHYDIIGFDPRGVNHSNFDDGTRIQCSEALDYSSYFVAPATVHNSKEYLASLRISNRYVAQCVKANPLWYTMSTNNVVRDLEIMRKVVTGDDPLNFLGSSYGTTIASVYIGRYPEHVGHIILDSPTTNANASLSSQVADARSFETMLDGWIRGYAKHSQMSVAAVKALMLRIRQWGDDDKLEGFAGIQVLDAKNHVFRSNESLFLNGIFALKYESATQAQTDFNDGLDSLQKYKWNGLFELLALNLDGYDTDKLFDRSEFKTSDIARDNSYEVMVIVNELDVSWPAPSDAQSARIDAAVAKASPFWTKLYEGPKPFTYTGDESYKDFVDFALEDDKIPDPPTGLPDRVNNSGKQVLVVGSRHESVTPYAFAVKTARQLKSPLVTIEGSEHAPVAGFTSLCMNRILAAYLLQDRLPKNGTSCKP